jgi:death on curing protein
MIRLTVDDAVKMYEMLVRETGGDTGLRDIGVLESSLYQSFATFDGADLYPSIKEKAARKAFAIIRNHPFVDGNKRMGLFVMLVFLQVNGICLQYKQEELVNLGIGVANGNIDASVIKEWIDNHKQVD